jgi:hypothetical protein
MSRAVFAMSQVDNLQAIDPRWHRRVVSIQCLSEDFHFNFSAPALVRSDVLAEMWHMRVG